MKGSPLFASFDFSVEACEPPPNPLLSGPIPMFDSTWCRENNASEDGQPEGMLIESSSHGTSYRLIRRSSSNAPSGLIAFPERRPMAHSNSTDPERRSNIGNFRRVLVAEDHKGTRRMLIQMLGQCGFESISAT